MVFRHEYKYPIHYLDYICIKQRLSMALDRDPNCNAQGEYFIRSLYFESPSDKALREKIDGVNEREKFRIRFYNLDLRQIMLEKKAKRDGLTSKTSVQITQEMTEALIDGRSEILRDESEPLLIELRAKMVSERIRPRVIVDYVREPFVFAAGNVRITLDREIRTGSIYQDALTASAATIPAGDTQYLLEVKYDAFLPSVVRNLIQLKDRSASAFSKYAACRMYG